MIHPHFVTGLKFGNIGGIWQSIWGRVSLSDIFVEWRMVKNVCHLWVAHKLWVVFFYIGNTCGLLTLPISGRKNVHYIFKLYIDSEFELIYILKALSDRSASATLTLTCGCGLHKSEGGKHFKAKEWAQTWAVCVIFKSIIETFIKLMENTCNFHFN